MSDVTNVRRQKERKKNSSLHRVISTHPEYGMRMRGATKNEKKADNGGRQKRSSKEIGIESSTG